MDDIMSVGHASSQAVDDAWLAEKPDDIGRGLPVVAGSSMRMAESRTQRFVVRTTALLVVALSVVYLLWRMASTVTADIWVVAVPLLALEALHAGGVLAALFALWDVDPHPAWHPVEGTGHRIVVAIPAAGRPAEVMVATIGAAVAIEPAHETWVLDEAQRDDVEALAVGMGAHYVVGSIVDAAASADVVAVVGPDDIVDADFLRHTLAYFDDPQVAVVQAGVGSYATGAFDGGTAPAGGGVPTDRRVVFAGRNRWNAARWEGAGAVVRAEALSTIDVAGSAVDPQLRASIRLHRSGWRIVAHDEVLVRSLTTRRPADVDAGPGAAARRSRRVKRSEHVLVGRHLSLTQRIAYVADDWRRIDGLRTVLFVGVPAAVIATGDLPVIGDLRFFAPLMLAVAGVQYVALRFLARGEYPRWSAVVFDDAATWSVMPSFGRMISRPAVEVDPSGEGNARIQPPWRAFGLLATAGAALAWGALSLGGLTAVTYRHPWAVYGTAVFLAVDFTLLVAAINRIVHPGYGVERRVAVRFAVDLAARLDDHTARVSTVSFTGAGVWMRERLAADPWSGASPEPFEVGQRVRLELTHQGVGLWARVARLGHPGRNRVDVALEFEPGQWHAIHELAVVLFHGELAVVHPEAVREHIHLRRAG